MTFFPNMVTEFPVIEKKSMKLIVKSWPLTSILNTVIIKNHK